jgi:hypothetical protein
LRVHPCGQQFQTKPVIIRVVFFDIARLHKLLSTYELEKSGQQSAIPGCRYAADSYSRHSRPSESSSMVYNRAWFNY